MPVAADLPSACTTAASATERYNAVRALTHQLCEPLVTEDYVVQSMPDVSPTKWHLAHTSWFFETFLLKPHLPGYREFDPHFAYLFNSYYVTIGDRHCRQNRGQLSRPTVDEVYTYRRHVDDAMRRLLSTEIDSAVAPILEIGLHHEQQHQELLVTDVKHVFWVNPMRPAYRKRAAPTFTNTVLTSAVEPRAEASVSPQKWIVYPAGVREIGHAGSAFAFDNESPRHKHYLNAYTLADRLVTNGEFKRFMEDGGYTRAELWLSAGIATAKAEEWQAPMYWINEAGQWLNHTLSGLRPVEDDEPVCHVSYFEADAYARWAGARLPTEAEWESAANDVAIDGNFVEGGTFHPTPAVSTAYASSDAATGVANPRLPSRRHDSTHAVKPVLRQMFGDVWQWTASAYLGYPGYRPPAGALGEYNGKFMCGQFVLRGGSVATPRTHIRATYRNFFPPDARWQFSGFRLARDA